MDQTEKFKLDFIYPPLSSNIRGEATSFDSHPKSQKLVYAVSNIIVVRYLDDLQKCTIFDQHKADTTSVRISASGNLCASGDREGNLFIWEVNTEGHPVFKQYNNVLGGVIKDLSWTNDGQRLAVGGEGKTHFGKAILVDSGSTVGEISGIGKRVLSCDIRQERPFRIAMGGEDNQVAFFEGPPFKFARSSKQHNNYVNCVRFSQNGEFLVSGSSDRKLFLYNGKDLGEIKEIKTSQPHTRSITSLAWIDQSTFSTSSNDTTIKIWSIKDDEALIKTLIVQENPHEINEMQVGITYINGDLFSLSLSGVLNQWKDVKNLENKSLPTNRYFGHNTAVGVLINDPINDSRIITGDYSGKIVIWDGHKPTLPEGQNLNKQILSLVLSEDSKTLYALGGENLASLDTVESKYIHQVECKGQTIGLVRSENKLYVLLESGVIRVFETQQLQHQQDIELQYETSAIGSSKCGQYLFVGDKKGQLHVLDNNGKELSRYEMWGNRISSVTVSQQSEKEWVVAGDSTGKMKLWNYKTNEEIHGVKWVYHTTIITSLQFSNNMKYVISTSQDNKIMLWNTESGVRLSEKVGIELYYFNGLSFNIDAHKRGILNSLITSDGRIITSGGDNAVKVWTPSFDLK